MPHDVGAHTSLDRDLHPVLTERISRTGATLPVAGLLINSELVHAWPVFDILATTADGEPVGELRRDHLAPDVLLVLWDGVPDQIAIREPGQGIHFGINSEERISLRHLTGNRVGYPTDTEFPDPGLPDSGTVFDYLRTDSVGELPDVLRLSGEDGLLAALSAACLPSGRLTPGQFALELVNAPLEQLLLPPTVRRDCVADTFAKYGSEAEDFGTTNPLLVKNEGPTNSVTRITYLRFDTTQLPPPDQLGKVLLRVYATAQDAGDFDLKAYATDNDWDESTLSWSERPELLYQPHRHRVCQLRRRLGVAGVRPHRAPAPPYRRRALGGAQQGTGRQQDRQDHLPGIRHQPPPPQHHRHAAVTELRGRAPMTDTDLIVPVELHALVANRAVRTDKDRFKRWSPMFTMMLNEEFKTSGEPEPYENERDYWTGTDFEGIHLQWQLPEALTTGFIDPDSGESTFPLVPNRWLVVCYATLRGTTTAAGWVVHSDYLSSNRPDADPLWDGSNSYLNPHAATVTTDRIGRAHDLATGPWSEPAQRPLFLTAIGSGLPALRRVRALPPQRLPLPGHLAGPARAGGQLPARRHAQLCGRGLVFRRRGRHPAHRRRHSGPAAARRRPGQPGRRAGVSGLESA